MANDFKNIIAIKEAAGEINQVKELLASVPKDFMVISGDDIIALETTLLGGAGVISVIGQGLPKDFSEMIKLGLDRDKEASEKIQKKLITIIDLIFEEGNPAGIKSLLKKITICNDEVRLPLVKATSKLTHKIAEFTDNY